MLKQGDFHVGTNDKVTTYIGPDAIYSIPPNNPETGETQHVFPVSLLPKDLGLEGVLVGVSFNVRNAVRVDLTVADLEKDSKTVCAVVEQFNSFQLSHYLAVRLVDPHSTLRFWQIFFDNCANKVTLISPPLPWLISCHPESVVLNLLKLNLFRVIIVFSKQSKVLDYTTLK